MISLICTRERRKRKEQTISHNDRRCHLFGLRSQNRLLPAAGVVGNDHHTGDIHHSYPSFLETTERCRNDSCFNVFKEERIMSEIA